jgi:hypothetical protein
VEDIYALLMERAKYVLSTTVIAHRSLVGAGQSGLLHVYSHIKSVPADEIFFDRGKVMVNTAITQADRNCVHAPVIIRRVRSGRLTNTGLFALACCL